MSKPKITSTIGDWNTSGSTNSNIERLMDDATYSSAHPDDTLVFVGPPRLPATPSFTEGTFVSVGMLQNATFNQQKPFQPLMAIGSSRSFFVGSKAQGSAQIQRLFMNTQNMLRRLYNNVIDSANSGGKIDPSSTDFGGNIAGANIGGSTNYLCNLDSEFFLIPFGMGVMFKTKSRQNIGAFYLELCVIPNYTTGIQAGQSMIMENATLYFDRLLPIQINSSTTTSSLVSALAAYISAG